MTLSLRWFLLVGLFRESYDVTTDVIDFRQILQRYSRGRQASWTHGRDLIAAEGSRSGHENLFFRVRSIQIVGESGATRTQHFDTTLPQDNNHSYTPIHVGEAAFHLFTGGAAESSTRPAAR